MRFDEATLSRLRAKIMKRGQTLATLLSEVMSGKDKASTLDSLLGGGKPGLRPEERLRLALDQIEARRKLIDAKDDRYGRCDICGEDLGLAALEEMPWADRDAAHVDA